ncbi:MAG: acetyl-CoA carboxylase biotin carboxyl carrier protein [Verrucomicrobiota bacterium]
MAVPNLQNTESSTQEHVVDLKDIKAIIDLMRKNSIAEFELEKEGFKIRLRRNPNGGGATAVEDAQAMAASAPATPSLPAPAAAASPAPVPALAPPASVTVDIQSPMIGTFYRAPAPEAAPYIEVGSEVNPDTVVCIIEAMKVMNEIKAETKGVVVQVLAENAKPVEFGQVLFKLRPL